MVKFYENSFTYDFSFPAVSLAYFLRYPNPYAKHVLSTDVIDRQFDPDTQRLSTTRLHLKRSKIPPAILKIMPKGFLGSTKDAGQSWILEKSVVDVREGWMETESRNLEWTGVLSVIEKQSYRRTEESASKGIGSDLVEHSKDETTEVTSTFTVLSRFGQAKLRGTRQKTDRGGSKSGINEEDDLPPKKGFFSSWSTSSLQRTIEAVGLRRTREALAKSKDGMNVVLERLRQGGLVGVLDGMRHDRDTAFVREGPWKRVWQQGIEPEDGAEPQYHNEILPDE
ncbi:hypothetical protein MMC20_002474 [Loxospora ochrophaea]|nr:hypothetical protein [Loxospora ochrophaea]